MQVQVLFLAPRSSRTNSVRDDLFCLQGGRGEAFLTFGGQGSRRWALFAGLNDLALRNQLVIMRCSRLMLQRREKDSRSKLQRTPLGT